MTQTSTWPAMEVDPKMNALILDSEMSPMNQLSKILKNNNMKEVEYKIANTNRTYNGTVYIIQASNGELTALGRGLSINTAKTNAALLLLNQIGDHVNKCTSTSNKIRQLPKMNKDRAETIYHNNDSATFTSCNLYDSTNQDNQNIGETLFQNYSSKKVSSTLDTCHPSNPEDKNLEEMNLTVLQNINYVGSVQEFCMAHNLHLPEYTFPEQNIAKFTAMCSLLTFKTFGNGKSKQQAKQNAASEMYRQIIKLSKIEIDISCQHNPPIVHSKLVKNPVHLSSCSVLRLREFIENLDVSNKKEAVQFLDLIAVTEGFTVEYITVINKIDNGSVMVILSTNPVIVYLGTGKTVTEAKYSAAYTALVHLQLLLAPSVQTI